MRRRFLLTTGAIDLLTLVIAAELASWIVFGSLNPLTASPDGSLLPLLTYAGAGAVLALLFSAGTWSGSVPRPSYARAIVIVGGGAMATAVGTVLFRTYWSRSFLLVMVALWLTGSVAYRAWARRRPWSEDLTVFTSERQLVADLERAPHVGRLRVIDPQHAGEMEPPSSGEIVVVDLSAVLSERVARYVAAASVGGHPVESLSNTYEAHTGRVALVHLAEGWEMSEPLRRVESWLWAKRLFETLAVVATAILWLPLLLVGALGVKMASPGPAFFRQERIGRNGDPFTLVKIRTMDMDAEANGPQFAGERDSRVFAWGRLLRRSRIDELPQLVNVLQGRLSLVGPRPEQAPFVDRFRKDIPFYDERHLVRPGITGWAQVNQGYASGTEQAVEKLTYDLYYLKHMSPWMDLSILIRSISTVLRGSGAR